MRLKIEYDLRVEACYVRLRPVPAGGVVRTECLDPDDDVFVDRDDDGRIVGVEFLGVQGADLTDITLSSGNDGNPGTAQGADSRPG
jgi:uncharacterized protein YuzE